MRKFKDYESMAMLELSDLEQARTEARFNEIVNGFSVLDAFDTSGIEPLVSVLGSSNIMREDVTSEFISRDDLLTNAPEQNDGYFQVPAAID